MGISDRQAADIRAGQALAAARRELNLRVAKDFADPQNAEARAITDLAPLLQRDLAELYAPLCVADPSSRDRLLSAVGSMVTTFVWQPRPEIKEPLLNRLSLVSPLFFFQLVDELRVSTEQTLDLKVYELERARASSKGAARRKHDKFEILDSPREYDGDFQRSLGALGASVIFFDLDNFKALNTRFTEPVIDRTLLPALMRLVASLAETRGFAYAEGGDEFLILLPNTNTVLAEAFTSVLLARICTAAFDVDGESVSVTASAGMASSKAAVDAQACREAASKAKHAAKHDQPKGGWVVSAMRV